MTPQPDITRFRTDDRVQLVDTGAYATVTGRGRQLVVVHLDGTPEGDETTVPHTAVVKVPGRVLIDEIVNDARWWAVLSQTKAGWQLGKLTRSRPDAKSAGTDAVGCVRVSPEVDPVGAVIIMPFGDTK